MKQNNRFFVIIPAAGIGTRFLHERPKQYLEVHGKAILEYSIECFLDEKDCVSVHVSLAEGDCYFSKLSLSQHPKVISLLGGQTRMTSVLNALTSLNHVAKENDWILFHDAVRPSLQQEDLLNFIQSLANDDVGGILANPAKDTMKLVSDDLKIIKTVDRSSLWHAATPQMFRYSIILAALKQCLNEGIQVTDESSAIEHCGYQPKIIEAKHPIPKLTFRSDLSYIALLLAKHQEEVGV